MLRYDSNATARVALAIALVAGCGAPDGGGRTDTDAPPSVAAEPARAESPPSPARATRFTPDRASRAVPAELAAFCQVAQRQLGEAATQVDTLAMPRSPRSLVGLSNESSAREALRCIVRTPEEWDLARTRVLQRTLSIDRRQVDFGREMLVVASIGGSWPMFSQLWIDGSWSRGDTLVVAVRQLTESVNGIGSGDGSPSVVVSVPRVAGPVYFIER